MRYGKHELSYSFFSDMNKLLDENVIMNAIINDLEIENAMHKALFYGKYGLADKLRSAYDNNFNAKVGEFDGFCYDSSRRGLKTKSIEEMYMNGEIRVCFQKHKSKRKLKKYAVSHEEPKGYQ